MTPEPDQPFVPVTPSRHVESLASVSDRVTRKQEQEKNRRRRRKPRRQISEQPEEQKSGDQDIISDDHIDFRA